VVAMARSAIDRASTKQGGTWMSIVKAAALAGAAGSLCVGLALGAAAQEFNDKPQPASGRAYGIREQSTTTLSLPMALWWRSTKGSIIHCFLALLPVESRKTDLMLQMDPFVSAISVPRWQRALPNRFTAALA
jgi:hypothetical protein